MSGKSEQTADRATVSLGSEVAEPDALLPAKTKADLPELVSRYLAGETMRELALDCRVARRTMYRWFLGGLGDEKYHEVVTQCLVNRIADADEELEDARLSRDPVRVTVARESCRFYRTDLERRRPALYGQKQEVSHTVSPTINIVLLDRPSDGGGGRVIDGTPVLEHGPAKEQQQGAA